ncbi:coenzyme A transporter [Kockovaella imperatae]|uniref:Coenzyme A transporter n=1 Tax=Kockovaella imperatae TaxID=4999 RepID=A0A1Y1UBL6_9TREE|nr:coenzyme A transporter [Kockovaella imperatae]ORX34914.1 coenzyme A transporter [Kockovaella imperatae]
MVDIKGKGRATEPLPVDHEHREPYHYNVDTKQSDGAVSSTWWQESRRRARADRQSWDYVLSSGVAGGIAGCVAKTAIAPLDRVKILFQTSNAEFSKYAGTPLGLLHASAKIYSSQGVRGLFQGHSATLLRIFPYAGIKFMAYDRAEAILIPTPDKRTPLRFFIAGATSGVISVLFTYPLELIRVRLAFQTRESERTSLREAVRSIYHEGHAHQPSINPATVTSAGGSATATATTSTISAFTRSIPLYPFYRGFSISIVGMVPYAGTAFLTYGTLKRHTPDWIPYLASRPKANDLACGAVAGLLSQTASYPFEVIRRRMQVGGARGSHDISWKQAVRMIYDQRGWRGFFVGLTIGYLKVVPMTSISFATWQVMKRALEI